MAFCKTADRMETWLFWKKLRRNVGNLGGGVGCGQPGGSRSHV